MSRAITVKIIPNDTSNPPGKLADVELHFTDGLLAGLKLIGFAVWQRRGGGQNVTFPARTYSVNGDRRSFALLRPTDDVNAQNGIRDAILQAWDAYERQAQADAPASFNVATPRGPVSDRSHGTAADYGSRSEPEIEF